MSARPDAPALVVAALPEELSPFARRLRLAAERAEGLRVLRTRAPGPTLLLAVTGDGPANAARHAARLCRRYRPSALVGVGVAGALTPTLAPFDLVVSAAVRNGSADAPWPDEALLARATAAGAIPGTLVSSGAPVVSAAGKRRLAEGAGEVAAVDMESAAWARAAAAAGIPFVVVRAIADGAAEDLPAYLADCLGSDGGIRRSAVVARALASPGSIPALLALRRRVVRCAGRLADFLGAFLGP